jgi:hypothetical protein
LKERGKLDQIKCFADGTFVPAKNVTANTTAALRRLGAPGEYGNENI